ERRQPWVDRRRPPQCRGQPGDGFRIEERPRVFEIHPIDVSWRFRLVEQDNLGSEHGYTTWRALQDTGDGPAYDRITSVNPVVLPALVEQQLDRQAIPASRRGVQLMNGRSDPFVEAPGHAVTGDNLLAMP